MHRAGQIFSKPSVSAFHDGCSDAQTRAYGRPESVRGHPFREFMPQQHVDFHGSLPFVVLGSSDKEGSLWATVATAARGAALMSATATSVTFSGLDQQAASGDPALSALQDGQALGMLGIELHTRRRNRLNGTVRFTPEGHLQLGTPLLSFGNCPQYITERNWSFVQNPLEPPIITEKTAFEAQDTALISTATTIFVASGHTETGVDVSHRGGPKGFVRVVDEQTLMFPDFPGNRQLKTVGNLISTKQFGMWFGDFEGGNVLQATGTAEYLWCDTPEGRAQRDTLLHRAASEETASFPDSFNWTVFRVTKMIQRTNALTVRWTQKQTLRDLTVTRIEKESASIRSIYLTDKHNTLKAPAPGQYLPIYVEPPSHAFTRGKNAEPLDRTYSISGFDPDRNTYRLSVKLQRHGEVSTWMHNEVKPGTVISSGQPQGGFVLDIGNAVKTVVLLSGGVGITPLLPMLKAAVGGRRVRVVWVHSATSAAELPRTLHAEAVQLLTTHQQNGDPNGTHQLTNYSREKQGEVSPGVGPEIVETGRLTVERLQTYLERVGVEKESAAVYVCGPGGFMATVKEALQEFPCVNTEAFGPSA